MNSTTCNGSAVAAATGRGFKSRQPECSYYPTGYETFDRMIKVTTTGIAIAALSCYTAVSVSAEDPAQARSLKLNRTAFQYAQELISAGHFIADGKGAWSEHRPSADQENEFVHLRGFAEYAKWHLGIDERYPENTKRRYKFPYGDFKNVHRCGLLAARNRAAEYRYHDIEDAAARLTEMISSKKEGAASLPPGQ
jgi:hypothetical protein